MWVGHLEPPVRDRLVRGVTGQDRDPAGRGGGMWPGLHTATSSVFHKSPSHILEKFKEEQGRVSPHERQLVPTQAALLPGSLHPP